MSMVEFPGLWDLSFTINRVAFMVFGIPIYWYGIIIAAGFLLAVLLGMKDSRKFGLEPDHIIDLVLYAAPVAIVTARLYYVIFSWEDFRDNPLQIFNTRRGGLAIYGAIIGAVAVAYIFAKKKRIGALKLFDFAAPFLVLAQGIGRWGNFVNQEAYGVNTSLPWGMTSDTIKQDLLDNMGRLQAAGIQVDPNMPVHPTFLYESLWDIAIFLFLLWFRRRKKLEGEVFFLYMILYGFGRFWIEGLRTDSLMLGSIRISQFLAALFVITLTAVFFVRRKKRETLEQEVVVGQSQYGDLLKRLQEDENIAGGEGNTAGREGSAADEGENAPDKSEDAADEDEAAKGGGENIL